MLDTDLAKKLIAQVTKYTQYNVNIMDEKGIIIASRDYQRVGKYHGAAFEILQEGKETVIVSEDDDYTGMRRGINMLIEIDGKREGVVGITGDPEEIRPVALIIKMAIETMIRYENEKIRSLKRQSKKERFMEMLIGVRETKPEEIRSLAKELGYYEDIVRIPVICRMSVKDQGREFLKYYSGNGRKNGDICFVMDEDAVLIFKAVSASRDEFFSSYRTLLSEDFDYVSEKLRADKITCSFFVGTFQDRFKEYSSGYRHCRWMEKNIFGYDRIFYFYDYVGKYLMESIPRRELWQIFHIAGKVLEQETKESCRELAGSLIDNDFRISDAAAQSFLHKNTFAYRYNKLLDKLAIDPRVYAKDKELLIFFYLFLKNENRSDN